MNYYTGPVECASYFDLNLFAYLMSLFQTNVPVHYQMKVYIALATSPACPQRVEAGHRAAAFSQTGFDNCLL
jgi:hypothetical protein